MELADVHEHDLEAPLLELGADPVSAAAADSSSTAAGQTIARVSSRGQKAEVHRVDHVGSVRPLLEHLDLVIHRALAWLTESPRLLALADSLYSEIRLALAKVDRIRRNANEQVASHRALLTLLERGDTDAAARELEQHLEHTETSMLDALHLPGETGH